MANAPDRRSFLLSVVAGAAATELPELRATYGVWPLHLPYKILAAQCVSRKFLVSGGLRALAILQKNTRKPS